MNKERWQLIDSLLDEVLDQPSHERKEFLIKACGEDAQLKRELETLLAATNDAKDFIETPLTSALSHFLAEEEEEGNTDNLIGAKVGSYRLQKLLGQGGMGTVYLASRVDDYQKEVAVKLTSPVFINETSAANFKRERQILAKLDHPNIARLLDGGTTKHCAPFLVMEYVDGLPLTTYCDEKKLSLNERLKLFLDVCTAVSYAHQNLIVHRDLKPNNILVTNKGEVKLLDFGIAKLIQPDLQTLADSRTIDTGILTPDYASPEQILGKDVTTSSDVYSLGVVLYELLTGERPFRFKNKSLPEILNAVTQTTPALPSKKTKGQNPKSLKGDLDAIVLCALSKNTNERYHTVEEFSADIKNYLSDIPVKARQQSFTYRTEKYLRRYKLQTAIAAGFVLLLLGWLITSILQANAARRQARENRRAAYAAEMILAANAWENANLARLRELVEKYQPASGEEDLRGFEWYFLKSLYNPASRVKTFSFEDVVWSVAFSPDGKKLAAGCNDGVVRLWDVAASKQIAKTTPLGSAWQIRFTPDGKKLIVVGSTTKETAVKIFDAENGNELQTLSGHTKRVRGLDVSPDGKLFASGSHDGTIRLWEIETGKELKEIDFDKREVHAVAFSHDGKKLVAVGSGEVKIIEAGTWKEAYSTKGSLKNTDLGDLWCTAFSPDDKTFAAGSFNSNTYLFNSNTGELLKTFSTHSATAKTILFTHDGMFLITGSWDRTVKFLNLKTGLIEAEIRGHTSQIHNIALSPDGKFLATASADFKVHLWNVAEVLKQNSLPVQASFCDVSAETGKIIVATYEQESQIFSLWDINERRKLLSVAREVGFLTARLSPDGKRFARAGQTGIVYINNTRDGQEERQIAAHEKRIFHMDFSRDGKRLVTASEDNTAKVFDVETGKEIFTLRGHTSIVKQVAFSSNSRFIASAALDLSVKIWDATNGREIFNLRGHTKPIEAIAFSPDGNTLASAGADDVIRLWNMSDGKLLQGFTGNSGSVTALAFSPDGKRMASASDVNVIRLWNTETGQQVLAFTAHEKTINFLKFTQDGNTLISQGSEGKIKFWQANK